MTPKLLEIAQPRAWSAGCLRPCAMKRRVRPRVQRAKALTVLVAVGLAVANASAAESDAAPVPPSAAAADVPNSLLLDDALRIFRARGFDLLLVEAQVKAGEADEIAASAVPNPGINAGISVAPSYRPDTTSGACDGCSGLGFSVGVTDNAAIIGDTLAGKRAARRSVAQAALAALKMNRVDALRVLEFSVKQQYVAVAISKATHDFVQEVVAASNQTRVFYQDKYRLGGIHQGDLARIETAKYAADNTLDRASQALRQAQVDLGLLLGIRGNVPAFEVGGEFARFVVPPRLQSATADALRREAFDHRPDLKAIAYQKERASLSIDLAKRQRFPDIALQAQYSQVGTNPSNSISPPTLFFGVSSPLPFFYQQQGEIRRAEADLSAQSIQRTKLEAQVVNDVETAHNNYIVARRIMDRYVKSLLEQAKIARDITKIRYDRGEDRLTDYLDAQRTFIATNLDYLQTLTSYWTAVFQLEQAVGMDLRR